VWDVRYGQTVVLRLPHDLPVVTASFTPDGKQIVTASAVGTARVWDASNGQPLTPPLVHGSAVNSASMSADGQRVVTASADKSARVWDAPSGAALPQRYHDCTEKR